MEKPLHIHIPQLRALHRFGDIYEQAILAVKSDIVEIEPYRQAGDSIGRHWYGMRCRVVSKKSGQSFYFHTGVVFLPSTRTGVMVELDFRNNQSCYSQVWKSLIGDAAFEINQEEEEYLKLFLPDKDFEKLYSADRQEQIAVLSHYFKSCAEAIAIAADSEPFRFTYEDLSDTYSLALAFEEILTNTFSDDYSVEICKADPDNFGQYASGYRYYLRSKTEDIQMYAYFGGIYSYKKDPAGIFAEIDLLNNQEVFARAFENIKSGEYYDFSAKEPKFIKLFLKPELETAFNQMDYQSQIKSLTNFLAECNTNLIKAASTKKAH